MSSSIKERPIILSTLMIQAILGGKKTQTRRAIKPQPRTDLGYMMNYEKTGVIQCGADYPDTDADFVKCPYGQVGDRLWVRETWREPICKGSGKIDYLADYINKPALLKWRSSIFMPRWASRLTLEITGVRVERLQEISPADCGEEGINRTGDIIVLGKDMRERFSKLWDSLNAKRGYGWDKNPWVWVIKFGNIGVRVK